MHAFAVAALFVNMKHDMIKWRLMCRGVICLLCIFCAEVASFHPSYIPKEIRLSPFRRTIELPNNHQLTSIFGSISSPDQVKKSTNVSKSSNNISNENYFKKHWQSIRNDSQDDLKTVSASFFLAIFIRILIYEPRFIPSLSMFPTFDIGDQLLVDKFSHINRPYSRKDVLVFNPSESYIDMTGNWDALIKRVVAVGGDTVEVKDNKLFVNGQEQWEPYVNGQPEYTLPLQVVPPGMLMMLGDNRNHSFDSHVWGFLPQENVIGRAVVKYWPLSRMGFVEGSD